MKKILQLCFICFLILSTENSFAQVIEKITSTGKTTGHIATITVTNPSANPVVFKLGTAIIPSKEFRTEEGVSLSQPQIHTGLIYKKIEPGEIVEIPVNGFCLDVGKPPLPIGVDFLPIDEWVTPVPIDEEVAIPTAPEPINPTSPRSAIPTAPEPINPTSPRSAIPTAPEPINPTSPRNAIPTSPEPINPTSPRNAIPTAPEPINPRSSAKLLDNLPPTFIQVKQAQIPPPDELNPERGGRSRKGLTYPGTKTPFPYKIDISKHPKDAARFIFPMVENIISAYDSLQQEGLINTPFANNEERQKEAVVQQAIWTTTSLLQGEDYGKEDFSNRMAEQFEQASGVKIEEAPEQQKDQFNNGIEQFWGTFELVGEKAKVIQTLKEEDNDSSEGHLYKGNPDFEKRHREPLHGGVFDEEELKRRIKEGVPPEWNKPKSESDFDDMIGKPLHGGVFDEEELKRRIKEGIPPEWFKPKSESDWDDIKGKPLHGGVFMEDNTLKVEDQILNEGLIEEKIEIQPYPDDIMPPTPPPVNFDNMRLPPDINENPEMTEQTSIGEDEDGGTFEDEPEEPENLCGCDECIIVEGIKITKKVTNEEITSDSIPWGVGDIIAKLPRVNNPCTADCDPQTVVKIKRIPHYKFPQSSSRWFRNDLETRIFGPGDIVFIAAVACYCDGVVCSRDTITRKLYLTESNDCCDQIRNENPNPQLLFNFGDGNSVQIYKKTLFLKRMKNGQPVYNSYSFDFNLESKFCNLGENEVYSEVSRDSDSEEGTETEHISLQYTTDQEGTDPHYFMSFEQKDKDGNFVSIIVSMDARTCSYDIKVIYNDERFFESGNPLYTSQQIQAQLNRLGDANQSFFWNRGLFLLFQIIKHESHGTDIDRLKTEFHNTMWLAIHELLGDNTVPNSTKILLNDLKNALLSGNMEEIVLKFMDAMNPFIG